MHPVQDNIKKMEVKRKGKCPMVSLNLETPSNKHRGLSILSYLKLNLAPASLKGYRFKWS